MTNEVCTLCHEPINGGKVYTVPTPRRSHYWGLSARVRVCRKCWREETTKAKKGAGR